VIEGDDRQAVVIRRVRVFDERDRRGAAATLARTALPGVVHEQVTHDHPRGPQ